ncbi:MAG: hypothetical protein CMK89_14620 [Pseudomonadales bacterium]|nr:hypothetical protein [Pseudomonadales bacterium]
MVNSRNARRVLDGLILVLLLCMVYVSWSLRSVVMAEAETASRETQEEGAVSSLDVTAIGVAASLIPPPPPGKSGEAAAPATGTGPQMEWRWPPSRSERADLYAFLQQCAVLELAVMQNGQIRRLSGTASAVPLSTLVRLVEGPLTPSELSKIRHSGIPGVPVRLFAEAFDQKVVRQLQNLLGESFYKANSLTGRYSLSAGHWFLTGFNVDGKPSPGSIRLDRVCVHSL